MDKKRQLIRFIENSKAFDNNSKLKAILFASEEKPNTFAHTRITDNLHDKHEFEKLLKLNKIVFDASNAKGFEEITGIKDNAVIWKMAGIWYGYDLFRNSKEKKRFDKYVSLIKKQKHAEADKLAGAIYGYPSCCVKKFIEEHDPNVLSKKYTYYNYYKRLHNSDKAFPFISHMPCSPSCKKTAALNKKYAAAINKWAPKFYKAYSKKRSYSVPVIVDLEADIAPGWRNKDGHEYAIVTKEPIEGRYYEISWLSKPAFKRGTLLEAGITIQYDYADVKIKKKLGQLKNFHHERKFSRL